MKSESSFKKPEDNDSFKTKSRVILTNVKDEEKFALSRENISAKCKTNDLSNYFVAPWWLSYHGRDEELLSLLEKDFQLTNAVRFKPTLKLICVAVGFISIVYGFYLLGSSESDTSENESTMAPATFVAGCLTLFQYILLNSDFYHSNPGSMITFSACTLGVSLLISKFNSLDFSTAVVMTFNTVLFTATPIGIWKAIIICSIFYIAFLALGFIFAADNAQANINFFTFIREAIILLTGGFLLANVSHGREYIRRRAIIAQHMVFSKVREVEIEAEKTQQLLRSMLPDVISEKLREIEDEGSSERIAEKFSEVTVMFVEVCDFNRISVDHTQDEVLDILNIIYSVFDAILEEYNAHKVETIGQVYMVVGGCPARNAHHAEDIADLSLQFVLNMDEINDMLRQVVPNLLNEIQIRIGLNSGSIVAGVIGRQAPRYKLFGDTVNTASRMESTCEPGKIQISSSTYESIKTKFELDYRGTIDVKGKGEMPTYFLSGRRDTIYQGVTPFTDASQIKKHIASNRELLFQMDSFGEADKYGSSHSSESGSRNFSFMNFQKRSNNKVAPYGFEEDLSVVTQAVDETNKKTTKIAKVQDDEHSAQGSTDLNTLLQQFNSPTNLIRSFFFIGNAHFREDQLKKSEATTRTLATLLMWLSGIGIMCLLILQSVLGEVVTNMIGDSKESNGRNYEMFLAGLFGTVVCTGMMLVLIKLGKRRALVLTLICYIYGLSMTVSYFSWFSSRPSPTIIILMITIIFQLGILSLLQRLIVTFTVSSVFTGTLEYLLLRGDIEYQTYTLNEFTSEDILFFFMYLVTIIFLQVYVVGVNDLFLYQDFRYSNFITHQNRILILQQSKTSALLARLLPPSIVPLLVQGGIQRTRIIERFQNATILFTDMVNFTSFSRTIHPIYLMEFLNEMYTRFDEITDKYKLYKVEIIGDAYFLVGGCPEVSEDHTERMLLAATEMMGVLPALTTIAHTILKKQVTASATGSIEDANALAEMVPRPSIDIRIGIHVGSIIAGVVGYKDPRYHVFGEAVGLANLMESRGEPGKIHISKSVHDAISENKMISERFRLINRGPIDLSPIVPEPQETFFVEDLNA